MGFCSLQHMEGSEVHLSRACRPATFRLQGLVTLLTAFALESRAGFVSHRQRSWDSPFGGFTFPEVSQPFGWEKPAAVGLTVAPDTEAAGRPARRRPLGSCLPEVLGNRAGV